MTTTQEIVRELRISASPETIYEFFVDPQKLTQWKAPFAILEPQPGGIFKVEFDDTRTMLGEYIELVPYQRVVFTWGWEKGDTALPPGASLVEVTFTQEADETIVRLRHSGLPVAQIQGHTEGWDYFFPQLTTAVYTFVQANS